MSTVTNTVLVILIVHGAVVLSQRTGKTLSRDAGQLLALIYDRQEQLLERMKDHDAALKELQSGVKQLHNEFACYFSRCESCT